jgi:hypothetical protein
MEFKRNSNIFYIISISAVIGWNNKFFSDGLFSVFFLSSIFLSSFFATAIVGVPHYIYIYYKENILM